MAQQKVSAKQREARIRAAQERERKIQAQKARKERIKRVFTVVVCIILVLALCVPTVAMAFLGGA